MAVGVAAQVDRHREGGDVGGAYTSRCTAVAVIVPPGPGAPPRWRSPPPAGGPRGGPALLVGRPHVPQEGLLGQVGSQLEVAPPRRPPPPGAGRRWARRRPPSPPPPPAAPPTRRKGQHVQPAHVLGPEPFGQHGELEGVRGGRRPPRGAGWRGCCRGCWCAGKDHRPRSCAGGTRCRRAHPGVYGLAQGAPVEEHPAAQAGEDGHPGVLAGGGAGRPGQAHVLQPAGRSPPPHGEASSVQGPLEGPHHVRGDLDVGLRRHLAHGGRDLRGRDPGRRAGRRTGRARRAGGREGEAGTARSIVSRPGGGERDTEERSETERCRRRHRRHKKRSARRPGLLRAQRVPGGAGPADAG